MRLTGAEDFAAGILAKYQGGTSGYYSRLLVYYRAKRTGDTFSRETLNRYFMKEFTFRLQQYEKKYYQHVTNKDDRRFLYTVEHIYNQPGEKKQLTYLFRRFGLVSREQGEWQETQQNLKRYEEELVSLKRKLQYQEEEARRQRVSQESSFSIKSITREVMEQLRRELRMERLMYGLDD